MGVIRSEKDRVFKPFYKVRSRPEVRILDQIFKSIGITCCVAHDFDYWQGGSAIQRERSDARLKQCVKEVGEPIIASMMLAGVRVGGSPYLPTPFRWGYGWPYPRGYKVLSESERQQVENAARNVKLEQYFKPKTKKQ